MQIIREAKIEFTQFPYSVKIFYYEKKHQYGPCSFYQDDWVKLFEKAQNIPVKIAQFQNKSNDEEFYLYIYRGLYYLTEIFLTEDEVLLALKNLWQGKKDKLNQELDRIKAKAENDGSTRFPISEEVQILVWNRDGGKCVKCGRQENLEFDHIIPVSKGGSSTARNIQLLCEHCNRCKGANIGG